ncbi:hypothetical protein CGZ80_18325 [Rhodopirellula sp. MGV]|nr:hypothetical protein CGZ80_18325 [Rhodopirellula sp. MGV]PNY35192.1 ligand-binding receptor [Rhodopirellula baltica]
MSTALTGPAGALGREVRIGVEAAFAERNRNGGIASQELELVVLDDAYEPKQTVPNMRTLIEEEAVLGIIANVGTPTAIAAMPIAIANKTPFIAAYSGGSVLRKEPTERYVINYRASYLQETREIVSALMRYAGCKPNEIAFFTQRDAFGDAGYFGGVDVLREHGIKDKHQILHVRYERNTMAIEGALAELLLSPVPPKAVIMVGAYGPCAKFIKLAKSSGLDVIFANVSFVGAESLASLLGDEGENVIVTQVVPHPESDLPIAKEFRAAFSAIKSDATPTFGALEGYIAARMLIHALDSCEGEITRDAIVDAFDGLGEFDLGLERPLYLSTTHHQASDSVWPTVIHSENVQPMRWEEIIVDAKIE